VTAYIADHGEDKARLWLAGLQKSSVGNVHPKHTPAVAAVAENQADVALVNHYYFYRRVLGSEVSAQASPTEAQQKLAEADIEIVFPEENGQGVAWNVSGAGLVKGGPNAKGARAVLAVLLSDAGQQAYAFTNREYPVVEGLSSPPGIEPAERFKWSSTSMADLAKHQEAAVRLIQELGLE
jgi:iron(III) transport system substrate-binding protein